MVAYGSKCINYKQKFTQLKHFLCLFLCSTLQKHNDGNYLFICIYFKKKHCSKSGKNSFLFLHKIFYINRFGNILYWLVFIPSLHALYLYAYVKYKFTYKLT